MKKIQYPCRTCQGKGGFPNAGVWRNEEYADIVPCHDCRGTGEDPRANVLRTLQKKESSLNNFFLISSAMCCIFLALSCGGNLFMIIITLVMVGVASVCLKRSLDSQEEAHVVELQLNHIHYDWCYRHSRIDIVDTETSVSESAGGNTWMGVTYVIVVQREITWCELCTSHTIHEKGKVPRLVR